MLSLNLKELSIEIIVGAQDFSLLKLKSNGFYNVIVTSSFYTGKQKCEGKVKQNRNSRLSFRSWWPSGKDHWHGHCWRPHSWACTSQGVPEECLLLVHCSPLTSGRSVTGVQLCQLRRHHQQHLLLYGYDPCEKKL